jgi:hypothetical protein
MQLLCLLACSPMCRPEYEQTPGRAAAKAIPVQQLMCCSIHLLAPAAILNSSRTTSRASAFGVSQAMQCSHMSGSSTRRKVEGQNMLQATEQRWQLSSQMLM